jgi:hypothetical protein
MVNKWVKTYDIVGFLAIAYDVVGKTYDVVCDGVGNIVGQSGNKWVKTYDIVGQTYDVVGFTYDVVGYYTILYTTAYTMS